MNNQKVSFDLKSLLAGATLGALIMFSVAATTNAPRANSEYKILQGKVFGHDNPLDLAINAATGEGWEFVSVGPAGDGWGFAVVKRDKK
ncbi:MAG TPA: hypothetical protein VHH73_09175 [Verrucomicrobiae bacterium]|nr:hypothetical protein [Verrucomicrobiae bacterium]